MTRVVQSGRRSGKVAYAEGYEQGKREGEAAGYLKALRDTLAVWNDKGTAAVLGWLDAEIEAREQQG